MENEHEDSRTNTFNIMIFRSYDTLRAYQHTRPEPRLSRPGAWASLWRRMGVKAAIAARLH
ncbi:hypothetical protein [Frigidibacter sp. SD6-1]|uniref:hypothetical protein n=1 Tax=Frigidibacter sp. SD6-1 TaxID=3032581 RepID=UPI0024E02021|nr:hypothetical protein [Frigidibacter sp. SD6-1]